MRSLFLKIFLWFWATVVLTGIALVLTFLLEPRSVPSRWHASLEDTARYSGLIAIEKAERGGASAASVFLDRLGRDAHLRACLFDSAGNPIAGEDCGGFIDLVPRVVNSRQSAFSMRHGITRVAIRLKGTNGTEYLFATELPAGPRAASGMDPAATAMRWGVAFLVSGLICYSLTRYLTAPILRLREASQRLAAGDLSTRAPAGIERRHDELGELVRDFNTMADRIEDLLSRQRQLIYDISHELRSPLARLNVALDLGREHKGNDPAFDQMEHDLERLSEMIGRLLTLAKIETAAITMERLNLTELAAQVVQNANFEAKERDVEASFTAEGEYFVVANAELLHSALENVIRNAIRYTAPSTKVEVELRREQGTSSSAIRLGVRDHGPGVPAKDLMKIFQPFYRVAEDRDRRSGGTGLGLAIADRVIRLHGGTIRAENASPCGLRVEIVLESN